MRIFVNNNQIKSDILKWKLLTLEAFFFVLPGIDYKIAFPAVQQQKSDQMKILHL